MNKHDVADGEGLDGVVEGLAFVPELHGGKMLRCGRFAVGVTAVVTRACCLGVVCAVPTYPYRLLGSTTSTPSRLTVEPGPPSPSSSPSP